jgi:titin
LNSIAIQWNAPSSNGDNSITGYKIEWNGGSGSTFVQLGTTGAATRNFAKEGLTNGQIYEFRVRATNEIGDSQPSPSVALRSAVAPGSPGAPTKTYADKTRIDIAWTAPSSSGGATISDYEVYMDDGIGGSFTT